MKERQEGQILGFLHPQVPPPLKQTETGFWQVVCLFTNQHQPKSIFLKVPEQIGKLPVLCLEHKGFFLRQTDGSGGASAWEVGAKISTLRRNVGSQPLAMCLPESSQVRATLFLGNRGPRKGSERKGLLRANQTPSKFDFLSEKLILTDDFKSYN